MKRYNNVLHVCITDEMEKRLEEIKEQTGCAKSTIARIILTDALLHNRAIKLQAEGA